MIPCRTLQGHQALFESATVTSRVTGYWERLIIESAESSLHHTAVNCDIGLQLSLARRPVLKLMGSKASVN